MYIELWKYGFLSINYQLIEMVHACYNLDTYLSLRIGTL